jgi:hypothetical protein
VSERTELVSSPPTALSRDRSATRALPTQQAAWVAAQTAAAACLALAGLWAVQPELGVSIAIGAGVAAINPRKLWAAPLAVALVVGGGLAFDALRLPAILGAGACAGLVAAWLVPQVTDWLDYVHGALATAAGASIGLWAVTGLLPAGLGTVGVASVTAALVGLVASQGLVPLALRFDAIRLPSRGQVRKALTLPYRSPVFKAFDLYRDAVDKQAPDDETRRGLCEVAHWVFRLQVTLQALDRELETIDVDDVAERIAACEVEEAVDEFTRERRQATAEHLRRLLEHRKGIEMERTRTDALVGYALAFLEEARAGLALARQLPGETSPDRLPEVLHRLRTHAAEGDARRKTAREMQKMQV